MKVKSLVCAVGVLMCPTLGTAADAPGPFVISSSPNLELRLSGRIHRMIQIKEIRNENQET